MSNVLATNYVGESWEQVPLADLVEFHRGLTYKKSDEVEHSCNAVLRANNIDLGTGSLDLSDIRYISSEVDVPESKRIISDSLLICTASGSRSHLGKIAYLEDGLEYAFGGFMGLLVPGHRVYAKYLYYLTRSTMYRDFIGNLSAGANINNLRFADLGKLVVPLPGVDKQKRIVAVLEQAFAALDRARAHAEANRNSSRELFGTLLEATLRRDASGWIRLPLNSLGTTQTGTTPKASEAGSYGDFIPFIKPGDFKLDGTLEIENHGLSAFGAKKSRTVPAGSALMVCIGATIGKAGFTETEIVTNQQINSIFPGDGISGEFLYYQFITTSFQKEVMRRSGQATLPIINKSKWSGIELAVPPDLAMQLRIVDSLREIRRHTEQLVTNCDQKLTNIANLRQSLLQKAFSGQLT